MSKRYLVAKIFEVSVTRYINSGSLSEAADRAEDLTLSDFVKLVLSTSDNGSDVTISLIRPIAGTSVGEQVG